MPTKTKLTDPVTVARSLQVMRFLMQEHEKWLTPSIREIGEKMHWQSSATTWHYLQVMKDAHLIETVPGTRRTLRPTGEGKRFVEAHGGFGQKNSGKPMDRGRGAW